ncbi:hypothetical protein GCM10007173_36970 [Glutamicibacter ardleyensis]|uniref:XRE family transcriptional regulator n=2 Tax=Glutamicibacter ardleyensis TaxID=225894 RepID=A0ABQ2E041_9MICC|nr:hypothetical protein GCM10007173_36970 [Glutamicibacter ardleyensis]
MDRNSWSLRALSSRADSLGFKMSHSNFGRLKDEPVSSMKGETIKMLARVLKVSETRVASAVLASMGITPGSDDDQQGLVDFVRTSSEVSARDQRILLSVIDAMREDESETNGQQGNYDAHPPRPLRSVAPTSDTSQGQKTDPDDSIIEFHGAEAKKYPAPPIESLAAHPKVKTVREQLDEHDENQAPESDA